MKKTTIGLLAFSLIFLLPLGYWAYGIYSQERSNANFDFVIIGYQLNPPITKANAIRLLGTPSRIEEAETTGLKGEAYYYVSPNKELKVVFINDDVFKAEYVSEKKS